MCVVYVLFIDDTWLTFRPVVVVINCVSLNTKVIVVTNAQVYIGVCWHLVHVTYSSNNLHCSIQASTQDLLF